jgi:hypothetical protein
MRLKLGTIILAAAFGAGGLICAAAGQENEKQQIKGGIEGKIKTVDAQAKTVTIVTTAGRERTFTVTEDTHLLGPRGGKVRRHLKDPRFREGFPVTVVAEGTTASEIHLGFARQADEEAQHARTAGGSTPKSGKDDSADRPPLSTRNPRRPPAGTENSDQPQTSKPGEQTTGRSRTSRYPPEEDEENEFPGTIKSFDPTRRMLVVALLNGKDRSFMLARDVKVVIRGAASRRGLQDPALKSGAHITVTTEEGGRRVKELEIKPAQQRRAG